MSGFEFRDLSGMAEMNAAEELQRIVWGRDDTPDPADLMMVIQQEGGLVAGAFLEEKLMEPSHNQEQIIQKDLIIKIIMMWKN